MQACELLDLPKTKYMKGFKVGKKGWVVWNDVYADGDRKRIRLSRVDCGLVKHRYVKPNMEVKIEN